MDCLKAAGWGMEGAIEHFYAVGYQGAVSNINVPAIEALFAHYKGARPRGGQQLCCMPAQRLQAASELQLHACMLPHGRLAEGSRLRARHAITCMHAARRPAAPHAVPPHAPLPPTTQQMLAMA